MDRILPRNTAYPCEVTENFTTVRDNQTKQKLVILQGEAELAKDCLALGTLNITGLMPGPMGSQGVDVTFSLDQDGQLSVSAVDQNTGTKDNLSIDALKNIDPEKLEQLKQKS